MRCALLLVALLTACAGQVEQSEPSCADHRPKAGCPVLPSEEPPGPPKDYCGQDLEGASFDGQDLRGANFSGANLRLASFVEADVTGANFSGADMTDTRFTRAVGLDALIWDPPHCSRETR